MIAYFGEVIKMCANISYLMMTLNRYMLVGNDHAAWLVKIAKLESKWVIRGSIVFGALINIGHGWEYQAVEDLNMNDNNMGQSLYSQVNGGSYSEYPHANQGIAFLIYSVVYFVINFGLFFILNTVIEVKIVRRMHKEMKDKRERMAKLHDPTGPQPLLKTAVADGSQPAAPNVLHSDEEKNKKEEDLKKEKRVIKMVVLNGILNFVLRAPDMLFWLENQNIWSSLLESGLINFYSPGLLSLILDVGYLSFILTFTTNFFIFYHFNSKFKEAVVFWTFKPKNQKF
jgi:hypothetical protein